MVKEVLILREDIVLDIPSVGENAFSQKLTAYTPLIIIRLDNLGKEMAVKDE